MILIILYHLDKPQIITNRPIALVSVYSEACGVCVPVRVWWWYIEYSLMCTVACNEHFCLALGIKQEENM